MLSLVVEEDDDFLFGEVDVDDDDEDDVDDEEDVFLKELKFEMLNLNYLLLIGNYFDKKHLFSALFSN